MAQKPCSPRVTTEDKKNLALPSKDSLSTISSRLFHIEDDNSQYTGRRMTKYFDDQLYFVTSPPTKRSLARKVRRRR